MFLSWKSMASKTDLRSHFNRKKDETETTVPKKKIQSTDREIIVSSSKNVSNAELEFVKEEVKKSAQAVHYSNISEHIWEEVGRYSFVNDTKAAMQNSVRLLTHGKRNFGNMRTRLPLNVKVDPIYSVIHCSNGQKI